MKRKKMSHRQAWYKDTAQTQPSNTTLTSGGGKKIEHLEL